MGSVWAPRVQNIIMHPSKQDNLWIADRHLLPNSPVQRVDIKAAEDIFGCNIGFLKGKTVAHGSDHVPGQTDGVPPAIKERYLNVTLPVDITFLNKMPLLITTSQNLHFGTVEFLPNRQISTVSDALK